MPSKANEFVRDLSMIYRLGTAWVMLLVVGGVACVTAVGQGTTLSGPGMPLFMEHFTGQEYRGLPQNWTVAQDADGLIYVGNRNGILVYDGVEWSTIPVSNHSTVRSLAVSDDNVVFLGVQGDFGFVSRDYSGRPFFVSLADSLDPSARAFSDDVWGTHISDGSVYFQTRDRLYIWDGESIRTVDAEDSFRTAFSVGGTYYIRDRGRGLLTPRGDSLVLIPGGELFADLQVFVMAGLSKNRVIVGTREDGLYLIDGAEPRRFQTEADAWLVENRLYSGTTVGDKIILGTLGGGIAIVDADGRQLQVLDEDTGLPDGWINYVFADKQGGIWLALHNRGLIRLDLPNALTQYDDRHGLAGVVNFIARDRDELVVSTQTGLYRLHSSRLLHGKDLRFVRDIGIASANIYHYGRSFSLVGTEHGLDIITRTGERTREDLGAVNSVVESTLSNRIYLGTAHGISVLNYEEGELVRSEVNGISDEIQFVVLDMKERVWALSRTRTLYRIDESSGDVVITTFGPRDGLPRGDFGLVRYGEVLGLVSDSEILRYVGDEIDDGPAFVRDERFYSEPIAPLRNLRSMVEDDKGRLWLVRSERVDVLTPNAAGGFDMASPPLLSIHDWHHTQVFVDDDGIVWLSNENKLYRYDPDVIPHTEYEIDLPPILREVTLVESGTRLAARSPASLSATDLPTVDYQNNAIRFDFALPSYNNAGGNNYQYILEGHDSGWSTWTETTHKNYTNLKEGRYRFRVRGQNAQGRISPETIYTFRILAPWYRTTWAYVAYLLLVMTLAAFAVQYRRMMVVHQRSKKQAEELERERSINERLQDSYRRLQEANESLLQADKLKDEFLANTSHELRTPLTAILGFASILKDEVTGEHREFMEMIEENGKRLLHTLNSLLDLAKLRVGMMETDMKPIDVTACVHEVGKLMMPLARKKGISLDVLTPSTGIFSVLDSHCSERILYNLVGNAIKFTDEGGVTILVEEEGDDVVVTVRDTGIGIEPEFIPHLFDEFRQESSGLTREHEGSGLGLAITNRLVMLMNGSLSVTSTKSEGSCFTVRFPRYHRTRDEASGESSQVAEVESVAGHVG